MSARKMLFEMSQSLADRASWARKTAAENPQCVATDDQLLPWVFCEDDQKWYSFDGNYSTLSPAEKSQRVADFADKRFERMQAAERFADEQIYWGKIRSFVLKRDKSTCQVCGLVKGSKLHVHHILKRVDGGPDTPDNLILVCPKCHANADRSGYNPPWVKA
jgi:hypothetical protein